MTSRERLAAAIEGLMPDRVPVDMGSSITGLSLYACRRLCEQLALDTQLSVMVKPLQIVEIPEPVLETLGIDTRYVRPNFGSDNGLEETYVDEWGITRKLSSNRYYYAIVDFPLKAGTFEELDAFPWPETSYEGFFTGIRARAKQLNEHTSFAVVADPLLPALFEPAWYLRGMQNFLIDLLENRTYAEKLLDILLELQKRFFDGFLKEVGEFIQVVMLGDDLGTQNAPLISPQLYRAVVKPRHAHLFAHIKKRTNAKLFLHSCGSIEPLIPDLIEAGVDILHPVQPAARGMDHRALKEKYGRKLCFWGGVDIQSALIGSHDRVSREVSERIRSLGRAGGYVLAPAHNMQPDTPPENIVALFRAAQEMGRYD